MFHEIHAYTKTPDGLLALSVSSISGKCEFGSRILWYYTGPAVRLACHIPHGRNAVLTSLAGNITIGTDSILLQTYGITTRI